MTRLLRLLMAYARRSFLQWLAGRAFLVTLVIEQAVPPLLGLALWSAALPDASGISTYYLMLLAVQLMTVSYENHTVANGIYAGTFSHQLVKPQAPVLAPLGENLAIRLWHVLLGIPLFAALWLAADVAVNPRNVLAALPAILMAAALRFLFTYTLALTAFWSQQAHGAVGFGETLLFLLGGAAVPIGLFPEQVQPIVAALPFRAMLGFPAEIAAGELAPASVVAGYGWQGLWTVAFLFLAMTVWRRGVHRYTAVGG